MQSLSLWHQLQKLVVWLYVGILHAEYFCELHLGFFDVPLKLSGTKTTQYLDKPAQCHLL